MDSKIRVRLNAFAERLSGPLGSVPLDRAIRADLELFKILRGSGATWPQIANALATAGARRPDGTLIGADHVRSAVTRQLKRTSPVEGNKAPPLPTDQHQRVRKPTRTHLTPMMNTTTHPPCEKAENRPTRANRLSKSSDRTAISEPPDEQRNVSIREKLERTRKLRES